MMNWQRRFLRTTVFLSCYLFSHILFLSYGFANELALPEDSHVKIHLGAIVSLTGAAAEQGQSWLAGARYAVRKLHERGVDVVLHVQDDQTNPRQAAQAFQQIRSASAISGMIGGTWDYLAETLYPLATRYKLPFVTPSNPPELVSSVASRSPYVFVGGLTLAAEERAIGEFLEQNKLQTYAQLYPELPWGVSHASMFRRVQQGVSNTRMVYDEAFPYEGYLAAVKVAAAKIVRLRPDVVYLPISSEGLDLVLREFEQRKYFPLIVCSQHLHTAVALTKNTARYAKTYGVYPALQEKSFEAEFQREMNLNWWPYSGAGYDAVVFLVELQLQNVDVAQRESFRSFTYHGVTGEFLLPRGIQRGVVSNQAQIVRFPGGLLTPVKEFCVDTSKNCEL